VVASVPPVCSAVRLRAGRSRGGRRYSGYVVASRCTSTPECRPPFSALHFCPKVMLRCYFDSQLLQISGVLSAGIWRCITRCTAPDVSKHRRSLFFKGLCVWTSGTSNSAGSFPEGSRTTPLRISQNSNRISPCFMPICFKSPSPIYVSS
jgi:hypothetical protein